jgi:hypothetical protein
MEGSSCVKVFEWPPELEMAGQEMSAAEAGDTGADDGE